GSAGDADDPRSGLFGELADYRADRARGGRDHHGLALLRPADLAQPDIGGEPRHAEHAEGGGERALVRIELEEPLAGDRAVELPAIAAQDIVARAEGRAARAGDLADHPAFDDGTDPRRPGTRPGA